MMSVKKSLIECINEINIEELQYVETDLCFYELVSLGFLLYGDDSSRAQYILQRLIILSQHPPQGKGLQVNQQLQTSDILRNYAKSKSESWRPCMVEALSIIRAKRVLRRLGICWSEVYHHFLPHVAEISTHIHPLLKSLYIISERLTPDKASKLINEVNVKCDISSDLRFYDYSYLEVFLLNWMTKRIIKIGNRHLKDCNVDVLVEYFKLNDMQGMKDLLLETINQNIKDEHIEINNINSVESNLKDSGFSMSKEMLSTCSKKSASSTTTTANQQENEFVETERYPISRKNAGYVLIINQSSFYKETDPKLQHLVPLIDNIIPKRKGTNVDRDKLQQLFTSFGYISLVFENLTHLEILHQIRETVKKSLLKDSLIVCILSHGMEGVVFGCNSIPVSINEIKEILTADTLKGKPKMLIIQACQRNVSALVTSSSSITDFSPDAYADILLAMSSIPGTDAMRHTEYGSWFVDSLYKLTHKHGERKHMLDILTAVICDISKRKGDANQVMLPTTSSTMPNLQNKKVNSKMSHRRKTLQECLNAIDVEDLQYLEADLSFYQLVSLGFLLFGDNISTSEFFLQRLVILAQNPPQGRGFKQQGGQIVTSGLLRNYAQLNPQTWKQCVVEALAIIRARRVIRKLGLPWQEIHHQYLPQIAEISVNIHPLLKALYKICERLTPEQAGRLINYIHTRNEECQNLRFYDFSYLEVFLLNWLTKRVIALGNKNLDNCNMEILIEYFKFNDMDSFKDLILETINQQKRLEEDEASATNRNEETSETFLKDSGISVSRKSNIIRIEESITTDEFDAAERYKISKENAGYVLIINQNKFYKETDPRFKHLLPDCELKPTRKGTDFDRDNLKDLFSLFGYTPLIFNNLTHLEILHQIRETVKKSLLKDSIIICILTHGMEGAVYGCNFIPVAITEIKEILTDDTLRGKPKMVFLQACQRNDPKVDTTSTKLIQKFSPDAYADILMAISAIKGTESLRDTTKGSWFVESICKFIRMYGNRKHMLDILTTVINDISKKKTDADDVMLPETSSTLRKELYLPS